MNTFNGLMIWKIQTYTRIWKNCKKAMNMLLKQYIAELNKRILCKL